MKYLAFTLCLVLFALGVVVDATAQVAVAPELPRVYLDTSFPQTSGATLQVAAGGDLQAALYNANPGDTIVIAAGAAFTGNFVLPQKSGSSTIVIRTSALDTGFPSGGTRVGPEHASMMPKILSPNAAPALATVAGAHDYRLVGIELGVASGVSLNYGIVTLGDGSNAQTSLSDVPHDIVLDRCYIHGNVSGDVRRGVALNSASTAIVESCIAECHTVGFDAQAICGWNGPGPFKITNNYLEGSGENILFGGADPFIQNLVPSDIEIRRNTFFKPLRWKADDPSYIGTHWLVKNLFELKNARRVIVEGNSFENNWADAQNGFSILFTVRNQDGTAPWSVVSDITFRNNIVRHVAGGINILGTDDQHQSQQTSRIAITNNVFEDVDGAGRGGNGWLFQLYNGSDSVRIDHNTGFQTGNLIFADGAQHSRFEFTNNITPHNLYGIIGTGTATGNSTIVTYFPSASITDNVITTGPESAYPAGNFFPAGMNDVGFVGYSSGNYRLSSSSPYRGAGTDGGDLGADIDAIEAAMGGGAPVTDTTPPQIAGLTVSDITTSSAAISWTTDEPSSGQVGYGTSQALGSIAADVGSGTVSHRVALAGLAADTIYFYQVVSTDQAGNTTRTSTGSFRTSPNAPTGTPAAVNWQHRVNCDITGASLRKVGGRSNRPDARASSSQSIASGDGYFEFIAGSTETQRWAGLGRDPFATDPYAIDFAVRLNARGKAAVFERGTQIGSRFSYSPGDVFRIAVVGGVVTYSVNGVVIYTSTQTPVYGLYANAALVTRGSTIDYATIYAAGGLARP